MTDVLRLLAASEGESTNVLALPLYEIVIGTIAFLIVFFVLAKLALPPLRKALDEREAAIEGGIKQAQDMQAESQRLMEQYQEQLAEARNEAAEIRTAAQAEKAQIIEEARRQAQEVAKAETARATAQIEAEVAKAKSDLSRSVGAMATDLAGKIVGQSLEDDQRAASVVDQFIAELESSKTGSGQV